LGAMLPMGGGGVGFLQACMRGHAYSVMENLDRRRRSPHVHALLGQAIGNAVETSIDFDVIIDVDGSLRPDRKIKALAWQRGHGGPVHLEKQAVAGPLTFLEGVVIKLLPKLADRLVEFS